MEKLISYCFRFSILLFCINSTLYVKAQLAPIGTTWTSLLVTGGGGSSYTYQKMVYTITRDSIIDSNIYSVISNGNYLMTVDSGRVFYFDKGKRRLFFDFNVKNGDTVNVDLKILFRDTILEAFPILIDNVYFLHTPQGDSLKQIDFKLLRNSLDGSASWNLIITEKILHGQSNPIFGPYLYKPISDFMDQFMCYHEPTGFTVQYVPDCDKVGISEVKNDFQLKLYPNPVNHFLFLQSNSQMKGLLNYSLYNSLGLLVLHGNFSSTERQLDVTNLLDGLYSCVIENENEKKSQIVKVIVSHKD